LSSIRVVSAAVTKELEPGLDMYVVGVKLSSPLIGVQSVVDLVIARLVQSAEVVPDLRYEGIETDGARVGVQSIPILVDLVIEDTDRAPECRIPAVTVYGLLVGFVCLGVLLL